MAKPKAQSLQNTLALYIASAIVVAILVGYFGIRLLLIQGRADGAKVVDLNKQIAALEKLGQDTETLRQNYEGLKAQKDKILALLPPSSEEEYLVATLGELATQSGVSMGGFSPQLVGSVEDSSSQALSDAGSAYQATITVAGSYSGLRSFLRSIEEGARFIDVSAIQIIADEKSSRDAVSAKIQLNAYYLAGGGSL